ncbi:MAG: radical SAM protein [Rhodothermales bacterium]
MNPSFTSILVSVTEGCHVGCAHCGFIGSKRDRETNAGELVAWVQQACRYGIPAVIFTGGEPFERFDVLKQGTHAAADLGVPSWVFTSSYWATSVPTGVETLRQLRGVEHLYLSTDSFHQKRIPYEYIHNVIAAADILSIPDITLCITYSSEKERAEVRANYERYGDRVRFYESRVIPTRFIRRAIKDQDPMVRPVPENYESTCWLETPIINPDGYVFACHAGKVGAHGDMSDLPYYLGNLRQQSFAAIMEQARLNVPYQYLRTHGPRGVAQLLVEYPELTAVMDRDGFTGPCDLCFSVLSTPEGRRCLTDFAHRPDVLLRINVRLALHFKEPPLEPDVLAGASPAGFAPAAVH